MSQPENVPLPPHNLEAEEYVLGAMMLAASAIDAVRQIIQPRDFYRESHARIYRAALDLHDIGQPVDAILLIDELDKRGQLEQIDGGKERIRELATLVPATSNAAHHALKVVEAAQLRDLVAAGEKVQRLGWDRGADTDQLLARAREIVEGLQERQSRDLDIETWHQFEGQAHDDIPVLIDKLWPEAAFGFIGAPPKKGKTWVGLAVAVAVAAGHPLFDHFQVPAPRPVLYVALEGHRAALRARVGAIARGMGLDPDGPDLDNLHWLYKPRGINLADPIWAQRLRAAATKIDAALVIVDVLRASARIKENEQEAFSSLRANLQPITDDGRSIALLHHNTKLSEISKERDPGERLSGSGAMYGALDVGIYITGSEDHARKLRLAFDLRDLATPDDISIELTGEGTSPNGGYGYRDTATWRALEKDEVAEADLKASPQEIYDWVAEYNGDPTTAEICFAQGISDTTLRHRQARLTELGITIISKKGRPTVYHAKTADELAAEAAEHDEQLDLHTPEADLLRSAEPTSGVPTSGVKTEETSGIATHPRSAPNQTTSEVRKPPEQGKHTPEPPNSPTESALAYAREAPTDNGDHQSEPTDRLAEQRAWITRGGWMQDDLDRELLTRFPTTGRYDLEPLRQLARECETRELGVTRT